MTQNKMERNFLRAVGGVFGSALVLCSLIVRAPFNFIDAFLGASALAYVLVKFRSRGRRHRDLAQLVSLIPRYAERPQRTPKK